MYIKTEDPDLPAFYYDPLIHPIASYRSEGGSERARRALAGLSEEELAEDERDGGDAFALPDGSRPAPRGHAAVHARTR